MNRWTATFAIVTVCATACLPDTACAAVLQVVAPNVVVMADATGPVTGSLIVGLTGTGAEQMGAYTFSVAVVPQGGATGSVSLLGARDIAGQLIDSSNFSFAPAGAFAIVADRTDLGAGTVPAATGDLFELDFLAGPGTFAVYDLEFLFNPPTPPGSEVQDGAGLPIAADFTNGSITVMVPEPGWWVLVMSVVGISTRRRRNAR